MHFDFGFLPLLNCACTVQERQSTLFLKVYNTVGRPSLTSDQLDMVGLFLWIVTSIGVLYYTKDPSQGDEGAGR